MIGSDVGGAKPCVLLLDGPDLAALTGVRSDEEELITDEGQERHYSRCKCDWDMPPSIKFMSHEPVKMIQTCQSGGNRALLQFLQSPAEHHTLPSVTQRVQNQYKQHHQHKDRAGHYSLNPYRRSPLMSQQHG